MLSTANQLQPGILQKLNSDISVEIA